jgi:hypothetical protein
MSSRRSPTFSRAITSFNSAFTHTQLAGRKACNICMSLAALLALSGCAGLQMKLGMRVDLRKIPVASIQASQVNGPGIAPGDKSPLVVTVIQPDGKKLTTEGKGKGPVRWKDLTVTSTIASANTKGVLTLPGDPRISDGKLPHVTITVPSHPDMRAELDIPVRYDRNYSAIFSGASGRSGWDGTDGTNGTSGMMGSLDPDHPSAGGDGTNGSDGTDGTDGTLGEDGPPVRVLVALRWSDPGLLLQVSVSSGQTEKLFLVDPHGGSLTVTSAGGAGGSGGRGGRGGSGGSGGIGTPNGRDGSNGMSGRDGINGSSGSGGPIFVTYDPRAKAYLGAIQLRNTGGPAPIMKEALVGPLW